MWRQGDVLIVRVRSLPRAAKPLPRDGGRVVLAYGEATGHAHVIAGKSATLYDMGMGEAERGLRLVRPCALRHEEHETVKLPAGVFRVRRQREYQPDEMRLVAD